MCLEINVRTSLFGRSASCLVGLFFVLFGSLFIYITVSLFGANCSIKIERSFSGSARLSCHVWEAAGGNGCRRCAGHFHLCRPGWIINVWLRNGCLCHLAAFCCATGIAVVWMCGFLWYSTLHTEALSRRDCPAWVMAFTSSSNSLCYRALCALMPSV